MIESTDPRVLPYGCRLAGMAAVTFCFTRARLNPEEFMEEISKFMPLGHGMSLVTRCRRRCTPGRKPRGG